MHGIKPRTLTNGELIQQASDQLHEGVLDIAMLAEVLRRLNYYTEGHESRILRSETDPRQLELPL
jgi:hypothetical protein